MSKIAHDTTVKVLILGDSAVGKSSILLRFVDETFTTSHLATIGIDYRNKTILCDDLRVRLQLWDTAGQERFRSLSQAYFRRADGIALVYDITSFRSFENVKGWMHDIAEYATSGVEVVLIGNKSDRERKREVSTEDAEAFAKLYDIQFIETSALRGDNVSEAFTSLTTRIIRKRMAAAVKNNGESSPKKKTLKPSDKDKSGKELSNKIRISRDGEKTRCACS